MTTVNENKSNTDGSDKTQQNQACSNNGQHEGEFNDKEQDVEIQENINEDDFIEGLDVVDTWDDEEKDKPRRRSWDRSRGRDRRNSRDREREVDRDRDNHRGRRRSRSNDRRRSPGHERRRDPSRRDPNKSSKDIEQDKLRTKKDNDSKMLAEKEKAIKNLLDSDEVVPPGTEVEAIQNMVDKNQQQHQEDEDKKKKTSERNSRENRRRSPIRNRLGYRRFSPRRSPVRRSPARRSPITFSPDRRRRSPDDRRRRSSIDRDTSLERKEASRRRLRERYGRGRSRSRDRRSADRHRSRSLDRHRRSSRSPFDRHSPRRRRRSLSRSPLRSPTRSRRRSPFINELARQFQNDPIMTENVLPPQQMSSMHGMGPGAPPYMPPGGQQQMMPPGLLPTPPQGMMSGPPGMVHGGMDMHQGPMAMHPVMGPGPGAGLPYGGYDACPPGPPGMNFDPLNGGPPPTNYSSGPIMYNQGNPMPINPHPMQSMPPPLSPQPVPAPGQGAPGPMYAGPPLGSAMQHQPTAVPGPKYSPNAAYNARSPAPDAFKSRREERMKTPEPPIISDFKPNDKTSLSSLLEASVSAKDSSNLTASFKGFKPEIIRFCERALRNLPAEDPRLRMKGRFFFDPSKKDCVNDKKDTTSNSILLRKGRTEIHWDEEENQLSSTQQQQTERKRVITHQKICQTEEPTRESIGIQADAPMTDATAQVYPHDFLPRDERWGADERPRVAMTDRLDWSMRETFDHSAKLRDNEDLRWTLSNSSSRDRPGSTWGRGGFSPNRQPIVNDHLHGNAGPGLPIGGLDGMARGGGLGGMDMRGGLDGMRDRGGLERMMDARERMMDPRDRGMDIRDAEARERELRAMELMRERDRLAEPRMGMMELGGRAGGGEGFPARREPLDDFPRGARDEYARDEYARDEFARDEFARDARPSIEDFDMRKGLAASFGRGMPPMERERIEATPRGGRADSPVMLDEDPEELEIIEERGFDRDQPWPARNSGDSLAQFKPVRATAGASLGVIGNNAAGAAMRGNAAAKRSFRGRIGGFRSNF